MTRTVQIGQVGEYLSRHVQDVFSTVLGLALAPSDKRPATPADKQITGIVGFAGESLAGTLLIHCSESFAREATAAMLGLDLEEVTRDSELESTMAELANLLVGGLKSWLNQSGASCVMCAPAVIRGNAFTVEPMPDTDRLTLHFKCGENLIVVEIFLQFTHA